MINNDHLISKQYNYYYNYVACVWENYFSHFLPFQMVWKIVWKMVWLCKFRYGINGWDLKILYRDLESWKKIVEKIGME